MSWSFLQSAISADSNAGLQTVTPGSNLSSGSTLLCYVACSGSSGQNVTSVKDAALNAFTKITGVNYGGSAGGVSLWALATPSGDAGSKPAITVNLGSSVPSVALLQEVSGITVTPDGTFGTDGGIGGFGNVGPVSYSSSVSGEYLVTVGASDILSDTWTPPAGYTLDPSSITTGAGALLAVAYKSSTGGAETNQWQLSGFNDYGLLTGAFTLGSSPPPPPSGDPGLLMVAYP